MEFQSTNTWVVSKNHIIYVQKRRNHLIFLRLYLRVGRNEYDLKAETVDF